MAAAQTELAEYDSHATDFPDPKNDDSSLVSRDVESLRSECVNEAAEGGIMQSGIFTSIDTDLLQSGNEKEQGAMGGMVSCGSIHAGDDNDSGAIRTVPANTASVLDRIEIVEGNCPDYEQMCPAEKARDAISSNKVEGYDHAKIADDARVSSTEQANPTLSLEVLDKERKVTIASHEDSEGVREWGSCTHANEKLTFPGLSVSNQAKAFEMDATEKPEDGTFVVTAFHGLEENQVVEDDYDMDFDLFDDEHCIFSSLDADKTQPWHRAVVDDVIMEESLASLHDNQHSQDTERVPLLKEVNKESDAELKENAGRNDDWLYESQQKPCNKSVQMDFQSMEENRALNGMHVQVNEDDAGHLGHEADDTTLTSDVVQDKELACKYAEVKSASNIQVQFVMDDEFPSLEVKSLEYAKTATAFETKRSEENVSAMSKEEVESEPVSQTHRDVATDLHELDYNIAIADCNPVSEDTERDTCALGVVKEALSASSTGVYGIVAQEKVIDQEVESEPASHMHRDVITDLEVESEPVSHMHRDVATDLHELDYNSAIADCNPVSEDIERDTRALGVVKEALLASSTGACGIVAQEKVIDQDKECLALANNGESANLEHSGLSFMDRSIDKANPLSTNSPGAPHTDSSSDVEHHVKAEALLEDERLESCMREEGAVIQGKDTCQDIDNLDVAKEDDPAHVKSGGSDAFAQLVNKSNCSPTHLSGALSADSSASAPSSVAEPEQLSKVCELKESMSLADCGEMPLEALSEPSVEHKTGTFEKIAMREEHSAYNNEMQCSCDDLSEPLHVKPLLESQGDEPAVIDRELNCTIVSGAAELVLTSGNIEESCETGKEGTNLIKSAAQEAKSMSLEDRQGELIYVCKGDDRGIGPIGSELKEVHVWEDETGEDEVTEARVETLKEEIYEKISNKDLEEFDEGSVSVTHIGVDEVPSIRVGITEIQDAVAERETEALDEVQESNSKQTSCSLLPDTCEGAMNQDLHTKASSHLVGITEIQDAVAERETEALDEVQESNSKQASCTLLPDAHGGAISQDLHTKASSHLPSLPYLETDMSFRLDLVNKVKLSDGPEHINSRVSKQNAAAVEPSGARRRASAGASSKHRSKRLKTDDKDPNSELANEAYLRTNKELHEGVLVGDHVSSKTGLEQLNDSSPKNVSKPIKQGLPFSIGDLVWAKVKSHPWWPAQIFDPADASKSARKAKKSGRLLVAFFGDCTFAWLQQSQMIPFRPNFKEKVQQTTMRIFCLAVEEALEELCRRSELGLRCEHFKGSLHSTSSFPDANTGIREGVRAERLKDICTSAEMFRPKKTLDFVTSAASSPLGEWSSTLKWAESRGFAYGLRTCMVSVQGSKPISVLSTIPALTSQESKLKRSHLSVTEVVPDAENGGKESKRCKRTKFEKNMNESKDKGIPAGTVPASQSKQVSSGTDNQIQSGMQGLAELGESNKPKNIIKIKLSKLSKFGQSASSESHVDTRPGVEPCEEQKLEDGKETLLAIAGNSAKVFKRSSSKEIRISMSTKIKGKQIGEASQKNANRLQAVKANPKEGLLDMDSKASLTPKTNMDDPSGVVPSLSLRDGVSKLEHPNTSVEIGLKREESLKDSGGKGESVRKFSKVGDSMTRVASELKGTCVAKAVDDSRLAGLELKDVAEDPLVDLQTSPVRNKALSKESSEDVSLLQLRRDLKLLAKNAGSHGAKGKAGKESKRINRVKVGDVKSFSQEQSVSQRNQRSCVQELALAARKRKSEMVNDEVLINLPRKYSNINSQQNHDSKAYITSAERLVDRRSYDKSLLLYSRRSQPPDFGMKSSSQRYNEKLSSHAPLGLFMRFPEDFPLPSETQLKAAFIPFGPLQMSATRLYKDSASAQVVFKHGRDAESALKHAKKNPIFGQVAVTYRLRHLSHSSRVEMKSDSFLSSKGHSIQAGVVRDSGPSRENREARSGFLGRGVGIKEDVSSNMLSSIYPDGESVPETSGDIQDQMMTLLRQVSVIVNTSPVTSDGT